MTITFHQLIIYILQTIFQPYTASTDGDETSAEENIRVIINSMD
jgi:hypothetical protein